MASIRRISLVALSLVFAAAAQAAEPLNVPFQPGYVVNPIAPKDAGKTVYVVAQEAQMPIPMVQTEPAYPKVLAKNKIAGQAVVNFLINEKGSCEDVHAISATDNRFAISAVDCVAKWKFKPGRLADGKAVRTLFHVPIVYTPNP